MSSPGVGLREDYVYQSQETITVGAGGSVDKKDVYVFPLGVVKFTNSVATEFVIQFFVRGEDPSKPNALHPDVDLFIPSFGWTTLVAGQGLMQGECKYRVVPVTASSIGLKGRIREIKEAVSGSDESASLEEDTVEFDVMSNTGKAGGGGTIHIGS